MHSAHTKQANMASETYARSVLHPEDSTSEKLRRKKKEKNIASAPVDSLLVERQQQSCWQKECAATWNLAGRKIQQGRRPIATPLQAMQGR